MLLALRIVTALARGEALERENGPRRPGWRGKRMAAKRPRIEHTEDFQELLPLCWWPEQVEYERIRQPVLFGDPVAEGAEQTGVSESTLRRRIARFEAEGMKGLFAADAARKRKLPPNIRRLIVDLKAEYPPFNLNEIANVVRACFGRKPDVRSVERVLDVEARPLKLGRNYPRYHEMGPGEGRAAVVELRVDGWSAKAIAGYLGIGRSTVYKILKRFEEEGAEGLEDRPHGRPVGVRKVTLAAIEEVRRLAQNPEIGAFRVHAALKQKGFDLSRTTCGRLLAQVREIYGYDKPKGGGGAKRAMPFASSRHHEFWTSDVRHLDMLGEGLLADGMVYAITIMENYSRAVLASSVTRRQDLNAFLSVLYRAVEHHGSPEAFVTDSGSVFLANRAQAIYRALGIHKVEIEKGQPWQSYLETAWGVQRRMADHYFAKAEDWSALTREHDRWMRDYNVQEHHAHRHRKEGRRSPSEVLSWVKGLRYREEDLARAFFSARHTRTLDDLGYLVLQRFRLYAEEGLAGTEVAVWVQEGSLTVEYGGEALSRYEVECDPAAGVGAVGRLRRVKGHTLFETSIIVPQLRLFNLAEVLGEEGWMKVLKLDEYAPRRPRRPDKLQQVLFSYTEAI
jgi:putative transposase